MILLWFLSGLIGGIGLMVIKQQLGYDIDLVDLLYLFILTSSGPTALLVFVFGSIMIFISKLPNKVIIKGKK